jgi:hypothetical protein
MSSNASAYDQDLSNAYEEIAAYKWGETFCCRKCGNQKFFPGKKPCSRRCSKCKTLESVTAHTAFHKLRMPLPVALDVIRQITGGRVRPMSYSLVKEIEERHGIRMRQKTYWDFIKKIMLLTAEEQMFNTKLTVFMVDFGSYNILHFRGKTENGEKYFARVYKGGEEKMYKTIDRYCLPDTPKVIATGKMVTRKKYEFEIVYRDTGARGYDIYEEMLELWSWLDGIHPVKSTQENIQMYLDAFSFAINGKAYERLMNILVADRN